MIDLCEALAMVLNGFEVMLYAAAAKPASILHFNRQHLGLHADPNFRGAIFTTRVHGYEFIRSAGDLDSDSRCVDFVVRHDER